MEPVRTAFITGASSGIGAALARVLANRGIHVALAARREDALEDLARDIRRDGGRARVYPLDVTDPAQVHEVLRRADDDMPLDLVVANAGVGQSRWSGKLHWDDIAPTLQVNVIGATATLTALIDRFVSRKHGHLVGISSLAAYRGLPKNAAYCASKAYLSTLLESLRVDLSATGVAVTDIRPGFVRTPMTEGNPRMPFLVEVDTAAREIADAIAARKAVYAFPLPMALGARSLAVVPERAYRWLAPKLR